jgi:hypothetical protein
VIPWSYLVARHLQRRSVGMVTPPPSKLNDSSERNRGVRILAKSIFKELTSQGYDSKQIVSLATELISEVTADLSSDSPD